jgi:hypothetical protein
MAQPCAQGLSGLTLNITQARGNGDSLDSGFDFCAVAANPTVPSGSGTAQGTYTAGQRACDRLGLGAADSTAAPRGGGAACSCAGTGRARTGREPDDQLDKFLTQRWTVPVAGAGPTSPAPRSSLSSPPTPPDGTSSVAELIDAMGHNPRSPGQADLCWHCCGGRRHSAVDPAVCCRVPSRIHPDCPALVALTRSRPHDRSVNSLQLLQLCRRGHAPGGSPS